LTQLALGLADASNSIPHVLIVFFYQFLVSLEVPMHPKQYLAIHLGIVSQSLLRFGTSNSFKRVLHSAPLYQIVSQLTSEMLGITTSRDRSRVKPDRL
jgi:hypothetical protein